MSQNTHRVIFQPSGRQGRVAEGTTLLEAARQLGVDVDSICGGRQTCGKCKVIVEGGQFPKYGLTSSPDHVTPMGEDEARYFAKQSSTDLQSPSSHLTLRLSCAARIAGDVLVTVPPESARRRQVVRKDAGDRPITIDPILRQMFVEVEPNVLGGRKGDWERLQEALSHEWGLKDLRIDIYALRQLTPALRAGKPTVPGSKPRITVVVWDEREVIDVRPGFHDAMYGLAVDVGSTTIAAHLCDLHTGAVLATESLMNPQITFGEDLMSRVSYVMMHDDGLSKLHAAVIGALNDLATQAAKRAGVRVDNIYEAVLVGNTVMHHILLGLDPTELGAAPFTLATHAPVDVKARDLGLRIHPAANVHLLALEAGHVGADNVGVLIAEAPDQQDEMMLVIDVGTNAEILLGNRAGVWSCSSPTGPAFEGAQITHGQRAAPGAIERVRIDRASGRPRFKVIGNDRWSDEQPPEQIKATGICGSGIIEAVAELFMAGILRADGRFDEDWTAGVASGRSRLDDDSRLSTSPLRFNGRKAEYVLATADQTAFGREIVITQDDVRNIQLAKAALYAGCKLLMRRRGVERVDRVVLAGAFGSYIDPLHAMVLGMFPDCDLSKVVAVGNAAGDGARIALLNKSRRAESAQAARRVHYIETAIDPHFQEEFVNAMHLPNRVDAFPHLEAIGVLPGERNAPDGDDARARRRRERRERSVAASSPPALSEEQTP
ncbi:MAG: ferredoxin [Candidatus Roseilinea sp.]|nr:MAG: ferredoxin [Candidatus Roseilinea sp.]